MSTIINNKEYLINEFKSATDVIQDIKIEFIKTITKNNTQKCEWLISLDKILNECLSLYPVLFNIIEEYVGYTYLMDCMYWRGMELCISIIDIVHNSHIVFFKGLTLTSDFDKINKDEHDVMKELIELL